MDVPLFDLAPSNRLVRERVLGEIDDLSESGAFTLGPQVGAFEDGFASFCGRASCVGVASGLDALRLALLAAGLESGDEVLVPAQTFVATLEAVVQAGGVPVLVDVDEDDYCIDVRLLERAITPRTKFVVPVHLYGQLADMRALLEIARRHELTVIEDACQSHGAVRDGLGSGAGAAAAFSFYPTKNLGAWGDAGAVVTDDAELAARVRALRDHGQPTPRDHREPGYTSRLDTVQAAVLLAKLPYLEAWTEERRQIAGLYRSELPAEHLVLPPVPAGSEPAWHLYVVRSAAQAELAEHLRAQGVGTGRHYPLPPHLTPAFAGLGHGAGDFPVAEALARECLSLPIYPGLTAERAERVVRGVSSFFS